MCVYVCDIFQSATDTMKPSITYFKIVGLMTKQIPQPSLSGEVGGYILRRIGNKTYKMHY